MPAYELNMPRLTATVRRDQALWIEEHAASRSIKLSVAVREALDLYRARQEAIAEADAVATAITAPSTD